MVCVVVDRFRFPENVESPCPHWLADLSSFMLELVWNMWFLNVRIRIVPRLYNRTTNTYNTCIYRAACDSNLNQGCIRPGKCNAKRTAWNSYRTDRTEPKTWWGTQRGGGESKYMMAWPTGRPPGAPTEPTECRTQVHGGLASPAARFSISYSRGLRQRRNIE